MVEHMVLFKLKDGVTDAQKQAMQEGLRALPSQISEIRYLACGEDFSGRSKGYHIGLVVRFDNRAGVETYGPHPAHKAFSEQFRELWDDVLACDFETGS